jgi:ppGpp synthetase/RelA/SpoT-type nucleotidyltranferase
VAHAYTYYLGVARSRQDKVAEESGLPQKVATTGSPDFQQFERWYLDYAQRVLDPARKNIAKKLNVLLDEGLEDLSRSQVRVVGTGRTKTARRAWLKLDREKYRGKLGKPEDVVGLLDDLIGLRITCNNLADQREIKDLLASLPVRTSLDPADFMAVQADSQRDYVTEVKESGYRAFHVNVMAWTEVGRDRIQVVAELQVRTVLQDAWGELTHEDTYNSNDMPRLVRPLTRRLADLLTTLDDIAEDIRKELDRLDTSAPEQPASIEDAPAATPLQVKEASVYLAELVSNLEAPTDLAKLAFSVRRELGSTVGWFGFGSFKAFLRSAVPDVSINDIGPSYVIPAGYTGPPPGSSRDPDLVAIFEEGLK